MKKPIKKDYCKPFVFDNKLVSFDSKSYAKDAEVYIERIEKLNVELVEVLNDIVNWNMIVNNSYRNKVNMSEEHLIKNAINALNKAAQ